MSPFRPRRLFALVTVAALLATAACSSDDDPAGNDDEDATLVGTWEATSFNALGTDLIEDGMSLTATFTAGGTYTFDVTNDQVGACPGDGGEDCVNPGPYTATDTQVTIDAGEEDAVTFAYSITGNSMTWTGNIDGFPVVVAWVSVN